MREPFFVGGAVVGLDRHQHLLRHPGGRFVAVHRLEDAVDELAGCQLLDLVEDEPLASDDAAATDVEHLHRRFEIVLGDADHVDVLVAIGDHLLLGDRLAHRREPIAQARRTLELELARGRPHRGLEALDDLVGVARQEVTQLVDELPVRHLIDLADARSGALLDVEQQARAAESVVLVELGRAARADREAAQQEVERVADRVGVGVRPEVPRALALAAAHHERPRPLLVDGHREERVALVVAQPDVEPRVVLLDQRELEHQRLDLVAHRRPLDRLRRLDHLTGARVEVLRRLEVVREALAKAGRLADVDHAAVGVLELIRAG